MKLTNRVIAGLATTGLLLSPCWAAQTPALATLRALTSTEYGQSVSISGATAAVGAPGEKHGDGTVYLFHRSGAHWRFQRKIDDPRRVHQDCFGWSVAVSSTSEGTFLAVGEISQNGTTNYTYIYSYSAGRWRLQQSIKDPQDAAASNFGFSVSTTASTLAIGAPGANNQHGLVYMYSRSRSAWQLVRTLSDPGPGHYNDNFGYSVSVSGATALVTANGTAYIYSAGLGRPWARSAILRNPSTTTDNFGWTGSLSGKTAVVGAPGSGTDFSQGAAYVYTHKGRKWKTETRLVSPRADDNFGFAVALSGNRLLVGAPTGGLNKCGIAYEFVRNKSGWHRRLSIKDPAGVPGDQFGNSVSVSGTTGIIGGPGRNEAFTKQDLF